MTGAIEARLLVVDDDPAQRRLLADFLREWGAEVREAGHGKEALAILSDALFDIVITDLRMPELDGHGLLRAVRALDPQIETIVVTAYGTVEGAVACLKDGAYDYLVKPLDLEEVEHVVRRALEKRALQSENAALRRRLGAIESLPGIVTASPAMNEVLSTVARVAPTSVSVLITGESGTGKELIARAIHNASPRAAGPFVAVNGAALAPTLLESELFGHERGAFTGAERTRQGRFEVASGGTLFLDEIGDLPADVQVKLLRVLQERAIERVGSTKPIPVDVRVVAATHRDLAHEVREGRFREDLFYRLAVVSIDLPPLRARRADVPLLAEHFLERHRDEAGPGSPAKSFSREALDLLARYDFPGNVRELENIVRRALVLSRGALITTDDLPPTVLGARPESDGETALATGAAAAEAGTGGSLPERVFALERTLILEALDAEGGHQTRAAQRLGISERALRYKLAKIRG